MTPLNSCPTSPNALCLHITEYSCSCGNRWTHSYPLLYGNGHYGGTPSPKEETTFPLARVTSSTRTTSHCFRCVPIGTPRGYAPAPKARAAIPSLSSLEDGIFS